jgi:erythronate-4-phosphate dehydrogenase
MLFDAVCRHFNITDKFVDWSKLVPAAKNAEISLQPSGDDQKDMRQLIRRVYDIEADDARLRKLTDRPAEQQGSCFDKLRKEYPVRREAWNYTVKLAAQAPSLRVKLESFRFNVQ